MMDESQSLESLAAFGRLFRSCLLLVSRSGEVTYANAAAVERLGLSEHGFPFPLLDMLAEPSETVLGYLREAAESTWFVRSTLRAKMGGRSVPMACFGGQFRLGVSRKEPLILLCMATEEQDEVRLFLEANKANEPPSQTTRGSRTELNQFAYVLAHDLQTPLRHVGSYAQLLIERSGQELDAKSQRYLTHITAGVSRMTSLISDLLGYSRLDQRLGESTDVDMKLLLDELMMNLAPRIESARAQVDIPEHLPVVNVHRSLLKTLWKNLIENAIRFTRPGVSPRLIIRGEDQGGHFVFSIEDNGMGIPQRDQERVFGIFQTGHPKDDRAGSGMGLAMCRKIVDFYGGRIWVTSSEEGSAFRFTLPKRASGSRAA